MSSLEQPKERLVKILFVGDSGVGKTSLFLRYADGIIPGDTVPTVATDIKYKVVDLETTKKKTERVKVQICDTAGQERFGTLTSSLYRMVQGVVICYDITDAESFARVNTWRQELIKYAPKDALLSLAGLKSDLEVRRQIATASGKGIADSWHIPFFEVSSKLGTNVEEVVEELARRVTVAKSVRDSSGKRPISSSVEVTQPKKPYCSIL